MWLSESFQNRTIKTEQGRGAVAHLTFFSQANSFKDNARCLQILVSRGLTGGAKRQQSTNITNCATDPEIVGMVQTLNSVTASIITDPANLDKISYVPSDLDSSWCAIDLMVKPDATATSGFFFF